ncbi:hypothetical protein AMECASPLE_035087 [Ameca splendens]|uniref:Uncharacterized protein n=1 Tax=Ameca splendens TaxID=208324 RepID=A0ABV0YID8_9TELE
MFRLYVVTINRNKNTTSFTETNHSTSQYACTEGGQKMCKVGRNLTQRNNAVTLNMEPDLQWFRSKSIQFANRNVQDVQALYAKLVEKYPQCLAAVIAAKCGSTKY